LGGSEHLYFTMTSQRREYPDPHEERYPKSHSFAARSGIPLHVDRNR